MGGMTRLLLLLWAGVTLTTALDLQKRIYGGETCKDDERLYHVKLLADNGTHDSLCGGSLVHGQWILTAAHCYIPTWTMKAVLRVHPGPGTEVVIKAPPVIFKDGNNNEHDIMLLKLDKAVSGITPIGLPDDCGNKPLLKGALVQIAGHGATTKKGTQTSPTLQCATLKIVDCPITTHDQRLCAESKVQDTCPGDSGGGYVYKNRIYGVHVTGGETECTSSAKFMDVCAYLGWIKCIIGPPLKPKGRLRKIIDNLKCW